MKNRKEYTLTWGSTTGTPKMAIVSEESLCMLIIMAIVAGLTSIASIVSFARNDVTAGFFFLGLVTLLIAFPIILGKAEAKKYNA